MIESLTFATLIANVDPVATLSILGAIGADKMLYSIVFGESMLNDSVSVVLFHTLTRLNGAELELTASSIFKLVGLFLGSASGSVAIGIGIGLVASFVFRHSSLHLHPPIEAILVFLFSYVSYSVPELLGLSGIMSLFFCGM
jgi:sodium/hydrogen exchanger-like protein 6/7